MAYNTKPIVTDIDGNPISQYYNKELDQYEPVEGSGGGNKVVLYNADGTENNSLSLIPILEKLSELTGTVIDEQTRQSNEQQRITFYNQLVEMLNTGQLKGDKGDTGETGRGLEFDWDGTRLGVRVEGDEEYIYVDLRGPQGPPGEIENLTSQHIEDTLGYLPVSPNDLEELRQEVEEAHTSLNDRVGDLENLDTTEKANLVLALNETYQELAAHKADIVQTDEVNSNTKYPSAAVTYGLGQEINALDNKLRLITISTVDQLNQLTGAGLSPSSSLLDIYNAMPIGSKLENFYVESSTHYPSGIGKIVTNVKVSASGGLLVFFYNYNSATPKLSYCMINVNGVKSEWKTFD